MSQTSQTDVYAALARFYPVIGGLMIALFRDYFRLSA